MFIVSGLNEDLPSFWLICPPVWADFRLAERFAKDRGLRFKGFPSLLEGVRCKKCPCLGLGTSGVLRRPRNGERKRFPGAQFGYEVLPFEKLQKYVGDLYLARNLVASAWDVSQNEGAQVCLVAWLNLDGTKLDSAGF